MAAMHLEIDLGGASRVVVIREGDDPMWLAKKFVSDEGLEGLGGHVVGVLAAYIEQQQGRLKVHESLLCEEVSGVSVTDVTQKLYEESFERSERRDSLSGQPPPPPPEKKQKIPNPGPRLYKSAMRQLAKRDQAYYEERARKEADAMGRHEEWRTLSEDEEAPQAHMPLITRYGQLKGPRPPLYTKPKKTTKNVDCVSNEEAELKEFTGVPYVPAARRTTRPLGGDGNGTGNVFDLLYKDADTRANRQYFTEQDALTKIRSMSVQRTVKPPVQVQHTTSVFIRLSRSSSSSRSRSASKQRSASVRASSPSPRRSVPALKPMKFM
eukprot:TRINITY_DN48636_c0_g1_i1.p1 TRINITY_DN48636_c0_g1~~TRINITY_DN48636_c0_g1_i1.p1  ORF type:complete len:342 (+),score=72.92 TRINITY_DN48636_c0_g1_i1:56-1027(+)